MRIAQFPRFHSVLKPAVSDEDQLTLLFQALIGKGDFTGVSITRKLLSEICIHPSKPMLTLFAKKLNDEFAKFEDMIPSLQSDLFLAHLISLIPYCYPDIGTQFIIPQSQGNSYALHDYQVTELLHFPISRQISDQTAYVLKNGTADPLLLFMGTTFPSAKGFCSTLISDCIPFVSVGALPFNRGYETLKTFFQKEARVSLYGMSLGGAFVFHAVKAFSKHIKQAYAIVPPGLYPYDLYEAEAKLTILTQEGDVVSWVGFFPRGDQVNLYHIKPPVRSWNGLLNHAQAFTGKLKVGIETRSVTQENRRFMRYVTVIAHAILSCLALLFIAIAWGLYAGISCLQQASKAIKQLFTSESKRRLLNNLWSMPLGS